MGIFSRLNTVIKSNLSSLIEKAEDPEKLIGQTVIDMKAELKNAKRELVTTLGTAKRLEKEAVELEDEMGDWERKAVLALKTGDDNLAREALKRKAKTKAKIDRIRAQADQQAASAQRMKDTIEQVDLKIDDLDARKSTLASQVGSARRSPGTVSGASHFGSATFDELDRLAGGIDQLDAEVEVHAVIDDPSRAAVDARFRDLESGRADSAVDDELAALKAKLDD